MGLSHRVTGALPYYKLLTTHEILPIRILS